MDAKEYELRGMILALEAKVEELASTVEKLAFNRAAAAARRSRR